MSFPLTRAVRLSVKKSAGKELPLEIGKCPDQAPNNTLVKKSYCLSGNLPPCTENGVLVMTVQRMIKGCVDKTPNAGMLFSAEVTVDGVPVKFDKILGNWTYKASWQGYRTLLIPSEFERTFSLHLSAALHADSDILAQAYLIPDRAKGTK